jgi:hypothetical protein
MTTSTAEACPPSATVAAVIAAIRDSAEQITKTMKRVDISGES